MIEIAVKPATRMAAVAVFLAALLLTCAVGCSTGASLQERVDAIDETYRASTQRLEEAYSFFDPMHGLDLEDKAAFDSLRGSLRTSMAAADLARADLEELENYDYSGDLEYLGTCINEYVTEYRACLDELKVVQDYMESLVLALEPYMEARGAMPDTAKMDPQQCLEPLENMRAACDISGSSLDAIEPPEIASEYHAYIKDLFRLSEGVIDVYIQVAKGQSQMQDITENSVVVQYLQLQPQHQGFVDSLWGSMEIANMDSLMEKVELEINRLYLER